MTASAEKTQPGSVRVAVQKFGSFLSGMIMPVIPALIAWGIITAIVVNIEQFSDGWAVADALSTIVGPMIHYLLPVLIAVQGGKMIYEMRGAVVGAVATFGVIAGSDFLIAEFNAALPEGQDPLAEVHMFIGAMIMGPLAAWLMKKADGLWEGKIKAGFEMLVNMFSAGILGFLMAVVGFFGLAPVINWFMDVLGSAVSFLVENQLLPLTSLIIEPAKVFFLNNAINHGVLTPLGVTESAGEAGKSILFLLEANPGPGAGVLLAFTIFGVGAARATAPGALLIHFVGGIHEVYFPYVLMKPTLLLAVVAGGATGVTTNMLFDSGLVYPAAPGSIIAVMFATAADSYLGVILSVILSTAVSFAVAAVILLADRRRNVGGDDEFSSAVAKTAAAKGKSSSHLDNLAGAAAVPASSTEQIRTVYFACDAGMGSSAMGASVLRKKFQGAGIENVSVTNKAIAGLPGDADLVITQQNLTDRARVKEPNAIHVSVDNFMNAPEYDDVVELVKNSGASGETAAADPISAPAGSGGTATAVKSGILTLEQIRIHSGAATQDQALQEAADILESAGAVTSDYLQAMRDREATVSTFMGSELAIPHGTNAAKAAIKASALSVVRYDGGVDWSGDHTTFVIGIAGVGDEHLEILSRIATLFADETEVAKLKAASTEQEILDLLSAVNEG
ncbi:PTS mannitol transporter subunit IICBA [Nesterenkonia massiliensis]|uniref:Mannitol-specific phosphotransferase enzyme IIA component n=1 Tax=Nesterenkonia massiliensis TaxID=1232429 RepID=A0ABT2HP42_9MICC|nr:PTS mannitol transporter subunit IICBA [Nesterenkonia massiliensis]MCT1606456.1 PTS mannitol transporter subunit IICBA [Nesterenkonia massiliensis]